MSNASLPARGLRATAVAIACAAVLDPTIGRTRDLRPPVDVLGPASHRHAVEDRLRRAGFPVNGAATPSALVAIGDHPPHSVPDVPLWLLEPASRNGPNVRVTRVVAPPARFPGQSARLFVQVDATGAAQQTTRVRLQQDGVTVATAEHRWTSAEERWEPSLDYLPPDATPARLRVVAAPVGSESTDDNAVDVRVPGVRAALRVLAYDANVSWDAAFVRRSLEGHSSFAVSARQRVSTAIATRAGDSPVALSPAALAPYEAIVIGTPDDLSRGEVDALRWFIDERGGVVVFLADRRPSGAYAALTGVSSVEERSLREPIALDTAALPRLRASELLVAHGLSPGSSVLATAGPDPIVVSSPRGAGRIVVFGAVDAWRWRAADDDGFARFWRAMLLGEAAAVVPRLAVDVEPTLVRPGERVQVRARLRATELRTTADVVTAPSLAAHIARASDPRGEPVRLWPTAQPGVFEGEWTASGSGDVDVTVTMGTATADATLTVDPDVTRASEPDVEAAAIAARGSGGAARPLRDLDAVVREIAARFPAQPVRAVAHPMRSPWWLLPFAAALTFEWAWRRTRGLQ